MIYSRGASTRCANSVFDDSCMFLVAGDEKAETHVMGLGRAASSALWF
jgi:hypothetical protein